MSTRITFGCTGDTTEVIGRAGYGTLHCSVRAVAKCSAGGAGIGLVSRAIIAERGVTTGGLDCRQVGHAHVAVLRADGRIRWTRNGIVGIGYT